MRSECANLILPDNWLLTLAITLIFHRDDSYAVFQLGAGSPVVRYHPYEASLRKGGERGFDPHPAHLFQLDAFRKRLAGLLA